MGDLKESGGHPQFPRQRVIPLDFPLPINDCLTEKGETPNPSISRKDRQEKSCTSLKVP
jgi:hypothetical protein